MKKDLQCTVFLRINSSCGGFEERAVLYQEEIVEKFLELGVYFFLRWR